MIKSLVILFTAIAILKSLKFNKGTKMQDLNKNEIENVRRWLPEIEQTERYTGVPAKIIKGIIAVESAGIPDHETGKAGEEGLMQVTPIAYKDLGYDGDVPTEPAQNILVGAQFLALQMNRMRSHYYNDNEVLFHALRAYNAGVQGALNNPSLSADYAKNVLRWSEAI